MKAKLTDGLVELHARIVASRSDAMRENCRAMDLKNNGKLRRLSKLKVFTIGDLLDRLPTLTLELKDFGIWLISVIRIPQAADVLIKMLPHKSVRLACASALGFLGARLEDRAGISRYWYA